MSPTSGAGLFKFYHGHAAGIIVFLYIANYYFYVKYPRFIGPCVIAIVTFNVIMAYELQVDQLGVTAETESSGQPYYLVYLFGPYKLLAVIVGCTIAFICTVFPYPITSRSQVRKLLGRGLFILASFYSCMQTTIEVWIDGSQIGIQSSPNLLAETRKKLFPEQMTLITAMWSFSQLSIYEPPVGGKFPKSTYDSIISEIQSVLINMALIAKILEGLDFNSHIITSLLCHLSAAVSTGTALPPQLSPPEPFPFARKLRTHNNGILDRKNSQDPAFAAFASLEVLSSLVNKDLAKLIKNVKSLVGDVKLDGYVKRPPRNQKVAQRVGET
ncbi:hypothetical protein L207DRAFT_576866 [Hyaloscypha variabilis F]|uniref:DUF2421 domain-containing protein n=1 Tax=Hyaloscypha variabilis (strain UAMH 11265 / GT02V1 / F) TaxID=1149755 RepID=A0A2J6S5D9_HYAVF|nr:hypothetical protein L207DRAFT_576866 [Hyaloscypha variabilis F]